ncbi:hypothetical protein ECDEC6E_3058 [Escherichia coli DEC6E]|nr:hypothetical protein ECDEC6E_3058 [Escherichia coli DEC6E]
MHYYGNTTCWKGREPDQQQKPPDFGGFLFLKESEFTCLSNIFYRLEFLILSRICLYLSEFGLISQVILLPNTAERAGVDNTLNKQ